jgi:hypothetical protein
MKLKSILRDLQVDKDLRVVNYKSLGLKSPKLSKALQSRGFANQTVSLLMQALRKPELELTKSEVDCIAQTILSTLARAKLPGTS